MAAAPVAAIRTSRPSVFVSGAEETGLGQALTRLSARDSVHGLYCCEASFGNWGPKSGSIGFLYFDRQKLDFGKPFEIRIDRDTIFNGRITALEAEFPEGRPPQITVLAEDRLQDMRMTRRTRSFESMSDADVFRSIAGDHGLQPQIDISGPIYKVVAQVNQSDLAFLRERARMVDAELWVDGAKLFAQKRASRNAGTVKLNYGADLRTFTVTADLSHQRTTWTVSGWGVAGKTGLKFDATASVIGRELESMESGAAILQSAIGARKDTLSHLIPQTADEAQAQAESVFRTFARHFISGHGVAQPNGKIRVGTYVDLQQLGPLFSGKYYVTALETAFDSARGLTTEFCVERPGLGRP